MVSGINVADLDALAARTAYGNFDRALYKGRRQRPFVLCGTAHIGLRIDGLAYSIHRRRTRFVVNSSITQRVRRSGGSHWDQSHAAEHDVCTLADVTFHRDLHRRAGRRINGGGTFECEISTACALAWRLDRDFTHEFVMFEHGRVGVSDEVCEWDRPFSAWAKAPDFCFLREEDSSPVSAGVGFGERAPDGAAIADLNVRNARRAVVQDGKPHTHGRVLNLGVSSQSAKAHGAVLLIDVARARNKVQIDQVARIRETQLHERNQALAAGEHLGIIAELRKHGGSFRQRARTMIMKRSRIHPYSIFLHLGLPGSRSRLATWAIARPLPSSARIPILPLLARS